MGVGWGGVGFYPKVGYRPEAAPTRDRVSAGGT